MVCFVRQMRERSNHQVRDFAKKTLLAGLAIAITLVGLEIALRLFGLGEPPTFDVNNDYGYLMRPNQTVSTRGYPFRINRAGLRGSDFAVPKPPGLFRILFLGDSITYGGGAIRDEDLFVNRVALELGKSEGRSVEAVNVSAPGWGFENMAGYVESVGLHDSDLVIWIVPSADFRRPKMTAAENDFLDRKPPSRLFYVLLVSWRKLEKKLGGKRPPTHASGQNSAVLERNLEVFDHLLARLTRTGEAVVVFIPSANGYDASDELARFRSVTVSRGVASLDMAPMFRQWKSSEIFLDGVHLSRNGHELVGKSIVAFLKREFGPAQKKSPPR